MLTVNQKLSLAISIFITAGYFYNLDWPQSLETPLMEQPYLLTSIQYNLIYLVTSLPLVIFSIPIGMLMDRLNIKYSVWTILGLQVVSQFLIAVVFMFFFKGFYAVILVLRIVFGLTSQTSFTLQSLMIEKVINKQNLDFVLNLCYSIPLVFDALNSFVSTQLYDLTLKPYIPLFVGGFVCVISLVCGLIMVKRISHNQQQKQKQQKRSQIQNDQNIEEQEQNEKKCQIKDIKVVPWEFWVYILTIFMGQSAIGPYIDNLTQLLIKRFGISYTTAGQLSMIPFGCCLIFSITLYVIIKRHQSKRRLIIIICNSLSLVAHIILFIIPNSSQSTTFSYLLVAFSLTCLSCSFAGYLGVLQVSTSMLIPKKLLGTAYGAVAAVNALSMSVIPLLNGLIIQSGSSLAIGFRNLQYAYIPISVIYLLLAVFMRFYPSQVFELLDKVRSNIESQSIKQSLIQSQSDSIQ